MSSLARDLGRSARLLEWARATSARVDAQVRTRALMSLCECVCARMRVCLLPETTATRVRRHMCASFLCSSVGYVTERAYRQKNVCACVTVGSSRSTHAYVRAGCACARRKRI
eukprot:5543987-Pleurochrysis_carterae.AAC.3